MVFCLGKFIAKVPEEDIEKALKINLFDRDCLNSNESLTY